MKVSVISTVYNGEAFLDKALPSILNQTHVDFDYIIIDDGSTDKTYEKLKEFEQLDSRIKVFSFGRLGRANALNKAVSLCSTEIIFQQDFDDVSESIRIERQLNYMLENENVGVCGAFYYIDDTNRHEKYIRMFPQEHPDLVRMFSKCVPIAHTVACFRKKAWKDAGGYPVRDDIEDLELWIKMCEKGWKVATVGEVLGTHYVYPTSFWHKNYSYKSRQKRLSVVQFMAVRELRLPFYYYLFPLGRLLYGYFPVKIKKHIRRFIGGSNEKDV